MHMFRSFLPVGQGAFYVERFFDGNEQSKYNVVYDCGSSTSLNIIETEIDRTFEKDESIDAVFISHLHYDHINGLKYLLKRCRVENLILPKIKEDEKVLLLIDYTVKSRITYLNNEHFVVKLINDPITAVIEESEITNIISVNPYNEEGQEGSGNNESYKLLKFQDRKKRNASNHEDIDSGQFITLESLWHYIPFNSSSNSTLNEEIKSIIKDKKPDEFITCWNEDKEFQKKIREIYISNYGGLNESSLVLYSGPTGDKETYFYCFQTDRGIFKENSCKHNLGNKIECCLERNFLHCLKANGNHDNDSSFLRYLSCPHTRHFRLRKKVGCIYTGDYNLSNNYEKMRRNFLKCWNKIGIIQIPHHGSEKSFNNKLLKDFKHGVFIISYGTRNTYKHPSWKIVEKILLIKNSLLYLVTEKKCSKLIMLIYI